MHATQFTHVHTEQAATHTAHAKSPLPKGDLLTRHLSKQMCCDYSSRLYIAPKYCGAERRREGLPLDVLLSAMGRCAPAPPVAPEPSRFTAGLR